MIAGIMVFVRFFFVFLGGGEQATIWGQLSQSPLPWLHSCSIMTVSVCISRCRMRLTAITRVDQEAAAEYWSALLAVSLHGLHVNK